MSARLWSWLIVFSLASCGGDTAGPVPETAKKPPLILYSSLPEETVRALTAEYSRESGIAMRYLLESAPVLIDKLETKAHRPGADLLLIADAGQLSSAVEKDVLRPTYSEAIRKSIPAARRDSDGYWFGLSARAVAIAYDTRAVNPAQLAGYESLEVAAWSGRLCLLSSKQEASRTMVAFLIASRGEHDAEIAVRNWKKNSAETVFPSGRELLLAIEDGRCQVGAVGSDAIAAMRKEGGAEHVAAYWPATSEGGVLVSLTGAGVTRHAANPEAAVRFLEWLASVDGQQLLISAARDLPLSEALATARAKNWTGVDISPVESAQLGNLLPDAIRLMERARY